MLVHHKMDPHIIMSSSALRLACMYILLTSRCVIWPALSEDCTLSVLSNIRCIAYQDMGGFSAQLESQLLIRHVTVESFRTFTIVAENEVSTALRDVRLLTRGCHYIISFCLLKQTTHGNDVIVRVWIYNFTEMILIVTNT